MCLCATVDLSKDVKAAGSKIDRVGSRMDTMHGKVNLVDSKMDAQGAHTGHAT